MIKNITKNSKLNTLFLIIILSSILSLVLTAVHAVPIGPTITVLGNQSKAAAAGTIVNTTINGTISPGGYIFTVSLNSSQQNTKWKGYVGNVTGTLVLDDASDNRLFAWTLSTVTGEVYTTRASGTINWTGINCTWIALTTGNHSNAVEGRRFYNRTIEEAENAVLSHTNKDDNITATFPSTNQNHSAFTTGSRQIGKNECFSIQTYQRGAAQAFADSNNANFSQVLLYDGAFNSTNGNLVYETKIESDITGYRTDSTYDFQMIVPENGAAGFSSSTAYYFYVELT